MNSTLGRDLFWRYWREGKLEVIGNSEGFYTVAVYNNSQTIPLALEIFLTQHLGGNYVGMGREKEVNPRKSLSVLIFCLPQSKEVETIKHPFMSRNDVS